MAERTRNPTIYSYVVPPSTGGETGPYAVGDEVDGYRIEGVLGKGGMGTVYAARHVLLDRLVAFKVLNPQFALNEDLVERFVREARALADVSHPGILVVHDLRLKGVKPYIVMERVDGPALDALLREKGRLTVEEALRLAVRVALALQNAHEHGIVHRDLKPANILVGRDGAVKVADFGLAALRNEPGRERMTSAGTIMGTPGYMAPEQRFDPSHVDPRGDLFSLGVILYEMITGRLPSGVFPPPRKLNDEVSEELSDFIMRLMAQERGDRPPDARKVAEILSQWLPAGTPGALRGGPGEEGAVEGSAEGFSYRTAAPTAAREESWADRSFVTALTGLLVVCLVSFNVLDAGFLPLAAQAFVPILSLAAIGMGWYALQSIRASRGARCGARFAVFGMVTGLWLFFIMVISSRFNRAPTLVFLARFHLVVSAVAVFALWDWLNRTGAELGTLFTAAGGRRERTAWLAVLLAPAFLLIPFLRHVEPEYAAAGFLLDWTAVGLGPVIYLMLVILPGLTLRDARPGENGTFPSSGR